VIKKLRNRRNKIALITLSKIFSMMKAIRNHINLKSLQLKTILEEQKIMNLIKMTMQRMDRLFKTRRIKGNFILLKNLRNKKSKMI